jgi:hypothetical protein
MRYRRLTADGDMTFGMGQANYHRDTPEGVAQATMTRLALRKGAWFLDTTTGTDYDNAVLGVRTADSRDLEIRTRILETQGVTGITSYASTLDPATRTFRVNAVVDTLYGRAKVEGLL